MRPWIEKLLNHLETSGHSSSCHSIVSDKIDVSFNKFNREGSISQIKIIDEETHTICRTNYIPITFYQDEYDALSELYLSLEKEQRDKLIEYINNNL
jgi:hypothetical protein